VPVRRCAELCVPGSILFNRSGLSMIFPVSIFLSWRPGAQA
jgi:hypothetical protein